MTIRFTKYRLIYFIFSLIIVGGALFSLISFGLKPGIDFTGGSILEVEFQKERPTNQEIVEKLSGLETGTVYVQPVGDKGAILRMNDISKETHKEVLNELGEVEERKFESIGPTIGRELKEKTNVVVVLALLSIVIYIALAFRKVQRPLRSWQYGIVSVIALFHDILIPLAVFAVLGKLYNIEVTIPVITALLAVLGYSINNTVVVFDRVRENLIKKDGTFEDIMDLSLNQTLARQINTSLTTLFVSAAIFFLGGETLKYFALTLIAGIIAGTYSSVFLAGPLLVTWYRLRRKRD